MHQVLYQIQVIADGICREHSCAPNVCLFISPDLILLNNRKNVSERLRAISFGLSAKNNAYEGVFASSISFNNYFSYVSSYITQAICNGINEGLLNVSRNFLGGCECVMDVNERATKDFFRTIFQVI
ncbi:MAG: hypothetical protein ACFKPT_30395 [Gloeotrichia echinulata GP01]